MNRVCVYMWFLSVNWRCCKCLMTNAVFYPKCAETFPKIIRHNIIKWWKRTFFFEWESIVWCSPWAKGSSRYLWPDDTYVNAKLYFKCVWWMCVTADLIRAKMFFSIHTILWYLWQWYIILRRVQWPNSFIHLQCAKQSIQFQYSICYLDAVCVRRSMVKCIATAK